MLSIGVKCGKGDRGDAPTAERWTIGLFDALLEGTPEETPEGDVGEMRSYGLCRFVRVAKVDGCRRLVSGSTGDCKAAKAVELAGCAMCELERV